MQLLLLDGATGSGKSSLLTYLREKYSVKVLVGAKLTTRQKRIGDNDWEFRFVEHISKQYSRYSFTSVGNHYAINHEELMYAINHRLIYAVSCVDRQTMELLKSDFDTVTIYVYRTWTATDLESLLISRGTSNQLDSQFRRDEAASIASQYFEKIEMYNHVILNVGSKMDMVEQLSKILLLHGITTDTIINEVGRNL